MRGVLIFDLTQRIDFKEKMIVRIAKTITGVTTEGMVLVDKGGMQPEILQSDKARGGRAQPVK